MWNIRFQRSHTKQIARILPSTIGMRNNACISSALDIKQCNVASVITRSKLCFSVIYAQEYRYPNSQQSTSPTPVKHCGGSLCLGTSSMFRQCTGRFPYQ